MLKNKHLLDPSDFTIEEFDEIFKLAHQIMANPKEYQNICNGKILAHFSMSQALEQDCLLNQQCLD